MHKPFAAHQRLAIACNCLLHAVRPVSTPGEHQLGKSLLGPSACCQFHVSGTAGRSKCTAAYLIFSLVFPEEDVKGSCKAPHGEHQEQ